LKFTLSPPIAESTLLCPIAGFGIIRADAEQLAALRREPGSFAGKPVAPAYLKNADDQTVAAVAVLLRAIAGAGWENRSFRDWGVVAAPNFFGRFGSMQALKRFLEEGAWGISPHVIPHHSLHAVSGTISQALKIHGPNFGISGGPRAVAEAFLVAATMLSENNLPGLWVILTGFDPEYIPEEYSGKPAQPTTCRAAALALVPGSPLAGRPFLRVGSQDQDPDDPLWPEFCLGQFLAHLEKDADKAGGRWRLSDGGWLELDWDHGAEMPR
jgi:hypothetical protein